MNFLLTNDDGISAEGLKALHRASTGLGRCVIAAPHTEHSNGGHRVSASAIRVQELASDEYVLEGTPADCTRLGILHLAPQTDWVLAGINHGANLGCDVFMSGTVAAVREAALCGLPAIAFSHYRDSNVGEYDWNRCARWAHMVLKRLIQEPLLSGEFWNVNFPHLPSEAADPEIVLCAQDTNPHDLSYHCAGDIYQFNGNYQARGRTSGQDVDVCFSGKIALSKLCLSCQHG